MSDLYTTLLHRGHLTLAPFMPVWNEDGTDASPMDFAAAAAAAVPVFDPVGDLLGLSAAARMTPKTYKRTTPMVDPMDAQELLSPDASIYLSTQDGNLAARSTKDGRSFLLTTDGTPDHEWRFDWSNPLYAALGLTVPVTNFSPDGTRLGAYKVDHSGVAQSAQMHYLKRSEEIVHRYSAKAGGTLERYTLHIVDLFGKPTVALDLGDPTDTYPVFAGWLPDSSEVILFVMTRDCRRVDVLAADPRTGATRSLFSEVGETFVRIHHDVYFGRKLGLTITPDGSEILWESERSGFKHLYRYDLEGKLLGALTEGDFPIEKIVGFAEGWVYLTARTDPSRPYDEHICRVPAAGGPLEVLTGDVPGVHTATLSPTGKAILDTSSAVDRAPSVALRSPDGTFIREVHRPDTTELDSWGLTPVEEFSVKAADGVTDLWGILLKPRNFDPAGSYPVIEYIYGGPQMQLTPHTFTYASVHGGTLAALTELGACVVVLDARGTPGRSKAFHDVVYKNWAGHLADDHAEAIKQLAAQRPYLDLDRVGVTGHSWGGYSSTRLLADRPDVYKAALSSAPGYDPYASVLYECYLGLPQDPGGVAIYDAANALGRAAAIERPLVIACGTSDHATWIDAVKMSEELIQAGVQHELMVLPEQYHGYDVVHDAYYHRKMSLFFAAHLQTKPL